MRGSSTRRFRYVVGVNRHRDICGRPTWPQQKPCSAIPQVHTKWLDDHKSLVNTLTGRDLDAELRQRPIAVHLTYVDPTYLAGPDNPRRHDSWTTGDSHSIRYIPQTVLVVENRDCRISFPEVEGTVVVEGGGTAATALVAEIPWVREAERVVYWGDMDTDW